ncbi:MAG: hypothetical protein ACREA0_05085 [bacterium]
MKEVIQQLAAAVTAAGPSYSVEITGGWSTTRRRTYQHRSQAGTGVGPFVDVIDARWRGVLTCSVPLVGFAFLDTPTQTFWVRSLPPATGPDVEVSVHARAGYLPGRASFAGRLFNGILPAVPFPCGDDPTKACSLGGATTMTGSAHTVAEVAGTAFLIILVPKNLVKVGRTRLWHFRPEHASSLDDPLRIFTRGRTGTLRRTLSSDAV